MNKFFKIILAVSVFAFFNVPVSAQLGFYPCATDSMSNASLENNPQLKIEREQLEEFTSQFSQVASKTNSGVVKIIPIVFHIIHNYGSENISKDQVEDAVRIINEDFKKLNPDTGSVIAAFQSIIGNVEVEFRLAKIDPNGNCTDGITRTVSTMTFDAGENVKTLISWNGGNRKYLNVWVVDNISSGAGAYAYLPGSAPSTSQRGIVCRNSQLGSIGTSGGSNFSSRTLTHEIGHHFNLYHIWGPGNNPGIASNCAQSDMVNDTPPTQGTSGQNCNLSQNTCGFTDNVQNYMDYSSCAKMFTEDQKTRMQAALASNTGGLFDLWQASNLTATGTNDGFVETVCSPIADFKSNLKMTCVNNPINFTDLSYNGDIDGTWSWSWSFPGGTPSTSTDQNPTITYSAPGTYNVTLTTTNTGGNNTKVKNQFVKIKSATPVFTIPVYEGLENASFPVDPNDASKSWDLENSTPTTWQRTTAAAYEGTASIKIDNNSVTEGMINSFISPSIDLTSLTPGTSARLVFRSAYAKRNTNSADLLRIFVSTNCGQSWVLRSSIGANSLVSNSGAFVSGNYVPTAAEWKLNSVNINSVAGLSNVRFKFECTSSDGNNLYIDQIYIGAINVGIESEEDATSIDLSVYPNPVTDLTKIVYTLSENEKVSIALYDVLGRTVRNFPAKEENSGLHELMLNDIADSMKPGIYFIQLTVGNRKLMKKIVKGE